MNENPVFRKLVSPANLTALAGPKAYELGREYFDEGAVRDLNITADAARAQVQGSATYRVVLSLDAPRLSYQCSCPRAGDGYFCKHCVAVGLAWLARLDPPAAHRAPGAKPQRRDPWSAIHDYLGSQEPAALIALVLDAARRDDRMYRSLLQKAERNAVGADLANVLRGTITQATHLDGYIAWDETAALVETLHEMIDSLAELLQPATSAVLVELLEYAVERVETMMEEVDDSDGGMGEICARLCELHRTACRMAMPDPVALAKRLFSLEMTLPFRICRFDPCDYSEALGEQGLHCYRELALAEWRRVERHADKADAAEHWAITDIMERLAEASGDVQQLVDIRARNLSAPYHYLGIAELWQKADEAGQALEWAERGLAAFPGKTDNRLRDFLAGIYLQTDRHDEALQLTWVQFEEWASLENYKKLARVAGQVGQWPAQRERALLVVDALLRARIIDPQWGRRSAQPDYSLRVSIALWEEDPGTAWEFAKLGDCGQELLIALAGKLEATRPDDAITLYRRVVPMLVGKTNNAAYEEAIGLVKKVSGTLDAHRRGHELAAYVADLRTEFKRKRNFITMLDRLRA
jgi:uncharacterized Zn finger protein